MRIATAAGPARPLILSTGVVDLQRGIFEGADGERSLSALEVAFLDALVRAQGRPVDRDTLLRDVWGYRPGVRSRSVDDLVKRLRGKIERDRRRPEHLLTVRQVGYRLVASAHPTRAGVFVGRRAEIGELRRALVRPGLTTLLGPGGMGKSALAREVVRQHFEPTSADVTWVDLEGIERPERALSAVAGALGIAVHGPVRPGLVGRWLADRPDGLLVLDAAEGVAAFLAEMLPRWRRAAPSPRILATSRIRLRAAGEQLVELGPLSEEDAATLIWTRARMARHDLPDTPQTRRTLAELAARLDRMPLAIELAAARSNLLSPSQLLDHLDQRLGLLSSPELTLSSVLDASWDLAAPAERAALIDLSVFHGGSSVELAAAVLDLPLPEALQRVQALRDQSWLRVGPSPDGGEALRLGMYDSVRDYLRARPEDRAPARLRHAVALAALGDDRRLQEARRLPPPAALAPYRLEHDNLRAALDTALDLGRTDLAVPLWRAVHKWLYHRGPFATSIELAQRVIDGEPCAHDEAVIRIHAADLHRRLGDAARAEGWARRAIELADAPRLQAQARDVLARLLVKQERPEEAEAELDRATAQIADAPPDLTVASLLSVRASIARQRGEIDVARRLYRRALAIARRHEDVNLPPTIDNALAGLARTVGDTGEAIVRYEAVIEAFEAMGSDCAAPRMNLANLHADLGDHDAARAGYLTALEEAQRTGNVALQAAITTNLASIQVAQGEADAALRSLHRALEMHREHRSRRMEVATLLMLGDLALQQERAANAERRFGEAGEVARDAGLERQQGSAALGLARVALLRGDLDAAEAWCDETDAHLAKAPHAIEQARAACVRGLLACARGRSGRRALRRALELAPAEAAAPDTEVGTLVTSLRRAMGG